MQRANQKEKKPEKEEEVKSDANFFSPIAVKRKWYASSSTIRYIAFFLSILFYLMRELIGNLNFKGLLPL